MNRSAAAIVEQAGGYAACFDRVSAHLAEGGSSALPVRLAADAELLQGLEQVSALIRLVEAERVRLAGEIAERCRIPDDSSLAKRMGAASAAGLVAERAFLSTGAAAPLVRLGKAVRARESLQGAAQPPGRPALAAAVEAGRLPVALACSMLSAIGKVSKIVRADQIDEFECELVAALDEGWSVDELTAWLKQVVDVLDPDGTLGREENLRALAQVTKVALDSGLTRYVLDLDPETAGLFETAMDAGISVKRPNLFVAGQPEAEDTVSEADAEAEQADRRPVKARRVDGVRLMATRALKTDDGQTGGTAVTMVVTISEESLRSRVGSACIDGIDQQISAATARMMAASAQIIPVVLGGDGQPVDYGDARRFFTAGQRRAMGARDLGCVGPGCRQPLSACEAAHITPAGWGPTAVTNGVMLCWRCHRLMDLHGWQISRRDKRWWWTPPPWVDPRGRLRPGGRPPAPDLTDDSPWAVA